METITTIAQGKQMEIAKEHLHDAVRKLLVGIGEDPRREGLLDTPKRFVKALGEMTVGYQQDPELILSTQFDEPCDEIVILKGIRFTSLCEHHLLPFVGTADIAYLPNKRVVGLSKLARLVECYARRLQIQERLTNQIASAIELHLEARASAVIVTAKHSCMGCRGAMQPDSEMVTSSMLGMFRSHPEARAELLQLLAR